jgi:hypothetical protein
MTKAFAAAAADVGIMPLRLAELIRRAPGMIPLTDIHRLYRSVKTLSHKDQLRRAEKMIGAPDYLRTMFERSIEQFQNYSNVGQPFHPPRAPDSARLIGAAGMAESRSLRRIALINAVFGRGLEMQPHGVFEDA